jgi:hypothetical protein
MSWGDDLIKIRRALRDPNANIWSDAFLLHLYNDVQKDFQHRTSIIEDFVVQRVPGVYHFAYMHDWEYENLPSQFSAFYQCLAQHDESVFCHRWEPQQTTEIDADVNDYGIHWTQPWEAFMGQTPGDVIRMRFPDNMRNLKYIAYDEEPIHALTKKNVQNRDSSYITVSGTPIGYYEIDDIEDAYVLYPRPASSFNDELDGNEGPAWYIEDDTEDVTTGTVAVRVGSTGTDNIGVPYDITDPTNNIFLVYDVDPVDLATAWDEGDFPEYLKKYIRFGVVSRAYAANTDGRIRSLSQYWKLRYERGVRNTYRYRRNRRRDRDYRLTTHGSAFVGRRHRHPRLPDTYPAVNP